MKTSSKNTTITLSETLKESILSRSAIINLFSHIDTRKVQSVDVDFENITFVSRSASHQLIIEKRELEKENVEVAFVKMSTEVKKMIEVVKKSLDKPKEVPHIHQVHFSSQKKLQKYLLQV